MDSFFSKEARQGQRIILIHNSLRRPTGRVSVAGSPPQTPLFTFLNRTEISVAASFSRLEVLLRRRKQIPKDARVAPDAESSTGILTGFPFAESRNLTSP